MSDSWSHRPLSACAQWLSGGTPSKSNAAYWGGDIPWISAKSLIDFFVSDSTDKVTSDAIGNGTKLVPKNTILFLVRGMSLKTEFRMGITTQPVTFNQDVKALIAVDGIDSEFLAYALRAKTTEVLSLVEEAGHGTGVLPTPVMQALEIPVPHPAEQKRIAGLCKTLDDKIELNRQMNATLEAMAQALFKSWFLDFDPVIDNALAAGNPIPEALRPRAEARAALGDRRKPLPEAIQQQFPSSFLFNEELGWVPEGWDVRSVEHAIEINPKLPLKKGVIASFVDMKALPTSGYDITDIIEKAYAGGAKFQQGDVLFARITPCLENGKTGIVDFLREDEVGFGSTEFVVLRGKGNLRTAFVACLARHPEFRAHCELGMVGSSGRQRVQSSSFGDFFVPLPKDPCIANKFDEFVSAYLQRMIVSKEQSISLAALRDTLLPKLLSGQLRIPDAEKQIAEAV